MRPMNESCRTYTWDMSHIWMRHVTHMNETCHTYEWDMSHIWMRHVTHMNESCRTYTWDMSHIWMSHVTHMNEACHTYEWGMSHIWINHLRCLNVSGCDMNESYHTWESIASDIWMCQVAHVSWVISHIRVTCDMIHPCVSGIISHTHVCHAVTHDGDAFICATWLIHMCDSECVTHTTTTQ